MKNLISVGTGLVYKMFDDQNARVKRIRNNSGFNGMELCIADAEYLSAFEPDEETIDFLKSLDYTTIHAPWLNIRYGNNEFSKTILKKLKYLYDLLGAKNVTVEKGEIDDFSVFRDCGFRVSIENDDWRKTTNTPEKIASILDENPYFGFTFDFAHALTIGPSEVREFIHRFRDRITQVHLSNLSRELKDHNFLHRDGNKEALELLLVLKENIDSPLVLECVANDEEEIDLIDNEISFLRNF